MAGKVTTKRTTSTNFEPFEFENDFELKSARKQGFREPEQQNPFLTSQQQQQQQQRQQQQRQQPNTRQQQQTQQLQEIKSFIDTKHKEYKQKQSTQPPLRSQQPRPSGQDNRNQIERPSSALEQQKPQQQQKDQLQPLNQLQPLKPVQEHRGAFYDPAQVCRFCLRILS